MVSRRCPDAGVGIGIPTGVFGHSGGSCLAEWSYTEPGINPVVRANGGIGCYLTLGVPLGWLTTLNAGQWSSQLNSHVFN